MAPQLPITDQPQFYLPAVAVDERSQRKFDRVMSRRLVKFERRFYVPRVHPRAEGRHSWQSTR